ALLVAEAIENQFRRAVRFAVAVAIRDEVEPRRGDDPDAAESDLDSGDVVEPLVKHGALVGAAIAVGVLENDDAILAGRLPPPGVERLGGKESPAVGDGERDRLDDVRLGGEDGGAETSGQTHALRSGIRGERGLRGIGGDDWGGNGEGENQEAGTHM